MLSAILPIGISVGVLKGLLAWSIHWFSLHMGVMAVLGWWFFPLHQRPAFWQQSRWQNGSCFVNLAIAILLFMAFGYFVKEIPFSRIRELMDRPLVLWWWWGFFWLAQLESCVALFFWETPFRE